MTLGPIVGLPAALRHGLLTQSQGEDAALWGINPHGGSYGEVLLICRGYLCYSGVCVPSSPSSP